jgi:hypothetical protein
MTETRTREKYAVYLDKRALKELRKIGIRLNVTVSEQIRNAIDLYLVSQKK